MMAGIGGMMGGAMGGQAGGQIMDLAGDAIATAINVREAKKAYRRQKDFYKRRYTWMVHDLKSAGINPILAASIGAGSAPPAITAKAQHSGGASNFGQTALEAIRTQAQVNLQRATARQMDAQGAINEARLVKERNQAFIAGKVGQALRLGESTAKDLWNSETMKAIREGVGSISPNLPIPSSARDFQLIPQRESKNKGAGIIVD